MRSMVPSAKWAAGERPLGLRGQAQLMLAAFIARNFPRIVLHSPSLSGWKNPKQVYSSFSMNYFKKQEFPFVSIPTGSNI